MSEHRQDPWEQWVEYSRTARAETQVRSRQRSSTRAIALFLVAAVAVVVTAALALLMAPATQEPEQSAASVAFERRNEHEAARIAYIRHYVRLGLRGTEVDCSRLPILPSHGVAVGDDEIVADINSLRQALHKPPLRQDALLRQDARATARRLAAHPDRIARFDEPQRGNQQLVLDGLASQKWSHLDEQALVAAPGNTSEVGACAIAGARGRVALIRRASYIGIGSARINDRAKVWVVEYGR